MEDPAYHVEVDDADGAGFLPDEHVEVDDADGAGFLPDEHVEDRLGAEHVAALAQLPEELHVMLRIVLDNDLHLVHFAMQAYLHAHHDGLLADWLAQSTPEHLAALVAQAAPLASTDLPPPVARPLGLHVPAHPQSHLHHGLAFPPRPLLPVAAARAVCPPAPAADIDGVCTDVRTPTFGQRLEATLVHAVGAVSLDVGPLLTSNFPGQVSLWTSAATRPPGLRTAPVPAGLSVVGRDALSIQYVDADPARSDLAYQRRPGEPRTPRRWDTRLLGYGEGELPSSDDDEESSGEDDYDAETQDQDSAAPPRETKLHPLAEFTRTTRRFAGQGGAVLRSFVGSLAYSIHLPLDRVARVSLLRAPVDSDEDHVGGQDVLVFDMAAPPTFSVHAVCALSKYHAAQECDDWTPGAVASHTRRWFVVAEQAELDSLIALIPTRVPVPFPAATNPVRAWWSWSDLVALANRSVAAPVRCERCLLLPPSVSAENMPPATPSTMEPPTPLYDDRFAGVHDARPRTDSASTCECCGSDLATVPESGEYPAAPEHRRRAGSRAAALADLEGGFRAVRLDSATDLSEIAGPGPSSAPPSPPRRRRSSGMDAPPSLPTIAAEEEDAVAAPSVTLHALPSPTLVRQVLEDTGLGYSLAVADVDGSSTPPLSPTAPAMSMTDVLAELKVDLGLPGSVRARERLEENLIARRQILNVLFLYGLLTDLPDDHPPTDLLHAESRTFPRRNHLLGTLKPIFTSCFTDFLNFECNPATLGEVLNTIPAHRLLRHPPITSLHGPAGAHRPSAASRTASLRRAAANAARRRSSSTATATTATASTRASIASTAGGTVPEYYSFDQDAETEDEEASNSGSARFRGNTTGSRRTSAFFAGARRRTEQLEPPPPPATNAAEDLPRGFFSLCRGCTVSADAMWHCTMCRTCVSADHHHCPSCNLCVYVPGMSSLPQFRPSTVSRIDEEDEEEAEDDADEAETPRRPSKVRIDPSTPADRRRGSAGRRGLANLRIGLRASVHYHPCPTCANAVADPRVLRAPQDTAVGAGKPWADAEWTFRVVSAIPPDVLDDAVAHAQVVVPHLVYYGATAFYEGGSTTVNGGSESGHGSSSASGGVVGGWKVVEGTIASDGEDSSDDDGDDGRGHGYLTPPLAPPHIIQRTASPAAVGIEHLLVPPVAFPINDTPASSASTIGPDPPLRRQHSHPASPSVATMQLPLAASAPPSISVDPQRPRYVSRAGLPADTTVPRPEEVRAAGPWAPVQVRPGVIAYSTQGP
ncbi:hypothetical protein H9P43_004676 [Blastocladiella emersonii ATCC 22665]|nr:hypothetical protein H9P43_004676 [Blastocladiella emersonii ATCC 22665]